MNHQNDTEMTKKDIPQLKQSIKFKTLIKKITFHPEVQKYIDTLKWPVKLPNDDVNEILE